MNILAVGGAIGSLVWVEHLIHLIRHHKKIRFLGEVDDTSPSGGWPEVAMIFAARDEEGMVGAATRSMLAQDYPNLKVIAVDDRSTDASGEILDAIARVSPALDVVHVVELPPAWLGKTNALQGGAEATTAPWILFTDADVVFEPGVVRRAIAFADRERVDHLVVFPEITTRSSGERLFLSMFGLLFSMKAPPGRLDDPRSKAHAGVGAFNLVRAEAFHAIGGFRHIKLSVDDDMRLGQAMKFAGYRASFLFGRDAVSVRWQVGLGGMIRGLEKNFFAGLDFRIDKVIVVMVAMVVIGVLPYVGLFIGPLWTRTLCALGVGSIVVMMAASARQSRVSWLYAALVPLAMLTVGIALVRSVVLTLARDGVRWRGHHYPLRELKAHIRRRDAWTNEIWRSTR